MGRERLRKLSIGCARARRLMLTDAEIQRYTDSLLEARKAKHDTGSK